MSLADFVRESNRIEGIRREPTEKEIGAHDDFLSLTEITVADLQTLVHELAGEHALLRDKKGMDVQVGKFVPMKGGPMVRDRLIDLLKHANAQRMTPHVFHCKYEYLHPFIDGNGRSGRAIWLWQQGGNAPLGFLHQFYYSSLDAYQLV